MDKMTRRSLLRALIGAFFARACICERFRLRSAAIKYKISVKTNQIDHMVNIIIIYYNKFERELKYLKH